MNILVLCIFPIEVPTHGGQIRVHNIVKALRSDNHIVDVRGVLGHESYRSEPGFVPFPGRDKLSKFTTCISYMEDYAIGRLFSEDDLFYEKLAKKINNTPDIIFVEHPWLFAFAVRYSKKNGLKCKLICGSANIEYKLKHQIIFSHIGERIASECSELVKQLECNAYKQADAIICVSESDQHTILADTGCLGVVVPNGVDPLGLITTRNKQARKITQNHRYALYVASAHPPNISGFYNMFSDGVGSFKPDEKLICVGGASKQIADDKRFNKSAKLAEICVIGGIVNKECLHSLLNGAQCVVLPITHGGGTNLKTAEALISGKYVVATSFAMRGFEKFSYAKGVHIADTPATFKQKLRQVMQLPPLQLSAKEIDERRELLWNTTIIPLLLLINKLRDLI